jgi:hypothetical protein
MAPALFVTAAAQCMQRIRLGLLVYLLQPLETGSQRGVAPCDYHKSRTKGH